MRLYPGPSFSRKKKEIWRSLLLELMVNLWFLSLLYEGKRRPNVFEIMFGVVCMDDEIMVD